jgi:hypothetical protein
MFTTTMGEQELTADELLLARAEANVTREEHIKRPTKFVAERNMSRRRRRIKMAPSAVTSCKRSNFFPSASIERLLRSNLFFVGGTSEP